MSKMFFQYILENVKRNPDKLAVKDSKRQVTYKELCKEVLSKRQVLKHKGISEKDKILLVMGNSVDWITIFLSFASMGTKVAMISPETKEQQIELLAGKIDCSHIITKENCQDFFVLEQEAVEKEEIDFPLGNCEIVYHITSGSTGDFKICVRTIEQFVAEGIMFQERLHMKSSDVIVCPIPIYHSYAFGAVIINGLMAGAGIVLMERFTPRKYLKLLLTNHATISFAIPAIVRLLVSVHLPEAVDLSCMRYLVIGAGVITEDVFLEFKQRFHLSLSSNYGSSETGGIITRIEEEKYPSIGRPMKNVEILIRSESGQPCRPDVEGELWVKAPSIMNRYIGKSDILDQNGYFFTGDLARQDMDGFVFITGRVKNIVNIGGKKVNPYYVEQIMRRLHGVKEVVVIGSKRKTGEEFLAAIIEGESDFDLQEIRKALRTQVEVHMVPSIIQNVPKIPKNEMGKIERNKVLELLKNELL